MCRSLLTHEPSKALAAHWTPAAIAMISLSCVVGVAISYLGWRARSLVTATCYTVRSLSLARSLARHAPHALHALHALHAPHAEAGPQAHLLRRTASPRQLLGVANKMLTVLANSLIWDQHASLAGCVFLAVCLTGAIGYKQVLVRMIAHHSCLDAHEAAALAATPPPTTSLMSHRVAWMRLHCL